MTFHRTLPASASWSVTITSNMALLVTDKANSLTTRIRWMLFETVDAHFKLVKRFACFNSMPFFTTTKTSRVSNIFSKFHLYFRLWATQTRREWFFLTILWWIWLFSTWTWTLISIVIVILLRAWQRIFFWALWRWWALNWWLRIWMIDFAVWGRKTAIFLLQLWALLMNTWVIAWWLWFIWLY